ncbi:hypothetical protein B9Z55_026477 [Caenorhabditis nigoni]|uniref:Uncharacterized protein n=1 Tax=Caenorhabditis nigoni TaxID=1611254 RepID=A0A2G5T3U5_9PELO|nr:hypothetical protein B9Z55_026477 [Caenorhabditis nigoni]
MRKIGIFLLLTLIARCLGQYCPRGKKVSMKVETKYVFNDIEVVYPNKYAYLPKFFTKPDTEWLAYPTEDDVGSHEIYVVVKGCKTAMLLELIVYDHHSPIKCEQPVYFMRKDGEEQTTACCNYRSSHFTDHTTINGEEKEVLQMEETEISEAINEEKEVIQELNIDSSSTSGPSDKKSERNEAFQIEESETTTEKIPNNEEKEVLQMEHIETSTAAISTTDEVETRGRMEETEAHFEAIPNTEKQKIKESLKMEDIETSTQSIPANKEKEVLQNSRIGEPI